MRSRRLSPARASTSTPMAWRGAIVALVTSGAAWGMGCADDDPLPGVEPSGVPEAGSPDVQVPPYDGGPGNDCTDDLDEDGIWQHLSCTGLYASFADKTVADDAKPFKPAAEFWSDGADKHRWVHLPAGQKIDISDWDEWKFPVGTKFWKEFKLGGKRIETRIFAKQPNGTWVHTSYRWNADETDAVAQDGGETIPGIGPDGGKYEIPNSGDCSYCHQGRKDQILGFDAVSLGLPGATGETLEKLTADGWLSATPPMTALAIPDAPSDVGPAKAKAAVAWLHTNCGACHNENASAPASFTPLKLHLHAEQLAPTTGAAATFAELGVYATGYCKSSSRNEPSPPQPEGTKFQYFRPKAPARSIVSVLSGQRVPQDQQPNSGVQMPPIVTRAVDVAGHKLVDDWINAMTSKKCPLDP